MNKIKILYVDDNVDSHISEYLCEQYEHEDTEINYSEHTFINTDSYETLLMDSELQTADILIIDSVLFENANFSSEKLTGEEFEVILKKVFPFKEVIVVSQNDIDENTTIIKKYDTSSKEESKIFFDTEWKPALDQAIGKVKLYGKILKRIEEKNYLEKNFLEGIQQSLIGAIGYEKLTVADIDRLISAFESVKKDYDNK